MSVKSIHNFEHAVHAANEWVKDLAQQPEVGSEGQAYSILRIVLHALRDRLRVDEVVHLSAQLPMLIRGFYFEGWRPRFDPLPQPESVEEFYDDVRERLVRVSEIDPEDAVYLVYELLSRRLTAGELEYAELAIPQELVEKWRPGLLVS